MLVEMQRHGLVSRSSTYLCDGLPTGRSRTNLTLWYGSADAAVQGRAWRFQQRDRRTWFLLDAAGRCCVSATSTGRETIQIRIDAAGRSLDLWQPSWRARLQIGEPTRGFSVVKTSNLGRMLRVVLPDDLDLALAAFMLWLIAVILDGAALRAGIIASS